MRPDRLALLACAPLCLAVVCAAAQLSRSSLAEYDLASTTPERRPLPLSLSEISGMASTPDGRVFAHADEQAIIAELDPRTGQTRKQFSLGSPAVRGDFEGIATARGRLFLVTSAGVVYAAEEGKADSAVPFERYETGAGQFCEIEGLAYDSVGDRLLLPCKQPRRKEWRDRMLVLGVPLRTMRVERTAALSVPLKQLASALGGAVTQLTSIEIHPRTGTWLLLGSNPSAVIELAADGAILGAVRLPVRTHPQPESLTFTRDLTLLIADEARGGVANLALYPRGGREP